MIEFSFLLAVVLSFIAIYYYQNDLIVFLTPQSIFKDGLIVIATLLPASILMGMSLPVLIDFDKNIHKHEKMYGINTLGGALGVLLFGFILLKYFGYFNLMIIIPFLSIFNMLLGWSIYKRTHKNKKLEEHTTISTKNLPIDKSYFNLCISALSGFSIFILEVLWFRHLEIIIGDRAYISSLILLIIIFFLGFSAYLGSALSTKIKSHNIIGIAVICTLISFLISYLFIPEAFYLEKIIQKHNTDKLPFFIFSFIVPIFFLGFIYPLILKHIQKNFNHNITALSLGLNSLAGMIGSLVGSYIAIQLFGVNSIFLIAVIVLGIMLYLVEIEFKKKPIYSSISFVLIIAFIFIGVKKLQIAPNNFILHENQSALTHFTLVNNNNHYEMYTGNYRLIQSYETHNVEHAQKAMAFIPALYHEDPKQILNLGLGYGITVGAFLQTNPEQIDSVELLPSVVEMNFLYKDSNNNQLHNPKVNTIISDGRRFLARSQKKYDIISVNITSPYSVGGSFFLTKEYYEVAKNKLNQDGIYSQMVWGLNNKEIIHTLKSVFPYVTAAPAYDYNGILLLASKQPLKLKKDPNYYNQYWSLFNNTPHLETFNKGEEIVQKLLKEKPKYIISDDRADILFEMNKFMGFLWTYKR